MHKWLMLLSIVSLSAGAEHVYTWTDTAGQVHYSDRPVPGAKQIEIYTTPAAAAPKPAAAQESAPSDQSQPQAQQPYTAFNVLQPMQQQTLWNIEGTLHVELELTPGLKSDHHIGVYLDGKLLDLNVTSLQFTVPEVYRGVHTLQAAIFDTNDKEVLRSLAVTFMVQQTSLLNPNNPNVRPPNAHPGSS